MNNGRFAISLHILTLLCKSRGELLSSDYIAGSININPVLVRKEIIQLRKAGYVDSKEGKNGGCFLVKKAEEISLAELFKLVYQNPVLSLAKNIPNPNCPVGKAINTNLSQLYREVEEAMLSKLAKTNLAEFCNKFDQFFKYNCNKLNYIKINIMKIAIIGATGFVGKALTTEALNRGHEVTAIARNVEGLTVDSEKLHKVKADIFNIEATAELLKNQDLVISSYNPGWTNLNIYDDFLAGSKAIQEAVKKAEKRLIVIGGGGSLYVAPGLQVVDTVGFPEEYKAGAKAARDYLTFIQQEKELDWTFFSPALEMHPGITTGRTGKFRLGKNNPVFNDKKESKLSVEDLAVVILDEAENPQHRRERFTAAY